MANTNDSPILGAKPDDTVDTIRLFDEADEKGKEALIVLIKASQSKKILHLVDFLTKRLKQPPERLPSQDRAMLWLDFETLEKDKLIEIVRKMRYSIVMKYSTN